MGVLHFVYSFISQWTVELCLLLGLMLLSIFVYKFLGGHIFLFLLGIYLGVELLGPLVTLVFNSSRSCQTVFPNVCIVHIPPNNVRGFHYLSILSAFVIICL